MRPANDNEPMPLDLWVAHAVHAAAGYAEQAFLAADIARNEIAPAGEGDAWAADILNGWFVAMKTKAEEIAAYLQREQSGFTAELAHRLVWGRVGVFFERIGELSAASGHAPGRA